MASLQLVGDNQVRCEFEISLVGGESNYQSLPDIRFLFLSLLPTPPPKREYSAVSAVADEVWQYRAGGNLTIFNNDHRSRTAEVLAAKHTASLQLLPDYSQFVTISTEQH